MFRLELNDTTSFSGSPACKRQIRGLLSLYTTTSQLLIIKLYFFLFFQRTRTNRIWYISGNPFNTDGLMIWTLPSFVASPSSHRHTDTDIFTHYTDTCTRVNKHRHSDILTDLHKYLNTREWTHTPCTLAILKSLAGFPCYHVVLVSYMPLQILFALLRTLVFLFSSWRSSHLYDSAPRLSTPVKFFSMLPALHPALGRCLHLCSSGFVPRTSSLLCMFSCELIHSRAFTYHLCADNAWMTTTRQSASSKRTLDTPCA